MKGIIFTESNFILTIQGIKTQTRRIIKPKPDVPYFADRIDDEGVLWSTQHYPEKFGGGDWEKYEGRINTRAARYKVGEIVYLKEPYFLLPDDGMMVPVYKFGNDQAELWEGTDEFRWNNKLFMPEKYARYFIKMTAVRAERLQDISDEDCIKEGIIVLTHEDVPDVFSYEKGGQRFETPQEAYAALIDKINGAGTWESNPFVWVIDYELLK